MNVCHLHCAKQIQHMALAIEQTPKLVLYTKRTCERNNNMHSRARGSYLHQMHDVNKLNKLVPQYNYERPSITQSMSLWYGTYIYTSCHSHFRLSLHLLSFWQTLLSKITKSQRSSKKSIWWIQKGGHLLCRLALQRIFSSSPLPSHLQTAFVKRVQNRTRTYADINCAGEKTTSSQTKRHKQKERLASNKCVAAHSTTVANSTLCQHNSEVSQRSVCKYMTRHQIILFHYNKNAAGYALAY